MSQRDSAQAPADQGPYRLRLPDGSRSERSPWVWRGLFFMALVALGLSLSFFAGGRTLYGAAWAVITVGWLSTSMWLWRRHHLATS